MDKIFIVICVANPDYQEAVLAYIRGSDYADKLVVRFFTSQDKAEEFLAAGEAVNILLAEPGLLPERPLGDNCAVLLLIEDDAPEAAYPTLAMYQPLNALLARAVESYARLNPNASQKFQRDRKTKVVSFYSSIGGAGKTAVALAAAHQLGLRDRRTLYLNMEAVSGSPLLPEGARDEGLSNLLYYLRSNQKQLPARFESLKRRNDALHIDYVAGPSNVRDLLELNETDTRKLLQALADIGLYDYIMVDMDSSVQERNLGIFQESDFVYWLMQRDEQCRNKTEVALKFLQKANLSERQFFDRLFFVMNKHLEEAPPPQDEHRMIASLPYIAQWKLADGVERYAGNKHFNHHVRQMLVASKLLQP